MRKPKPPTRTTVTLADVVVAYQSMRRLETALTPHDLTVFLLALLASIAEVPDAPLGTSARNLAISPAVVTGGVDRLEKRGLVTRVTRFDADRAGDHRQVRANLTARGRELLAELATIELAPEDDPTPGAVS